MSQKLQHNWSGWPGAWCLNCGCFDPTEQAIADGLSEEEIEKLEIPECPGPKDAHNPYVSKIIASVLE